MSIGHKISHAAELQRGIYIWTWFIPLTINIKTNAMFRPDDTKAIANSSFIISLNLLSTQFVNPE